MGNKIHKTHINDEKICYSAKQDFIENDTQILSLMNEMNEIYGKNIDTKQYFNENDTQKITSLINKMEILHKNKKNIAKMISTLYAHAFYHVQHDVIIRIETVLKYDYLMFQYYIEKDNVKYIILPLNLLFHNLSKKHYLKDDLINITKNFLHKINKIKSLPEEEFYLWKSALEIGNHDISMEILQLYLLYDLSFSERTFKKIIKIDIQFTYEQLEILLTKLNINIIIDNVTLLEYFVCKQKYVNIEVIKLLINQGAFVSKNVVVKIVTRKYNCQSVQLFNLLCKTTSIAQDSLSYLWIDAIKYNYVEILNYLVDKKINPNITLYETTPLILAIQNNNTELVKKLLNLGACVETTGLTNYSAIHYLPLDIAILNGNPTIVQLLLNHNVSINGVFGFKTKSFAYYGKAINELLNIHLQKIFKQKKQIYFYTKIESTIIIPDLLNLVLDYVDYMDYIDSLNHDFNFI